VSSLSNTSNSLTGSWCSRSSSSDRLRVTAPCAARNPRQTLSSAREKGLADASPSKLSPTLGIDEIEVVGVPPDEGRHERTLRDCLQVPVADVVEGSLHERAAEAVA